MDQTNLNKLDFKSKSEFRKVDISGAGRNAVSCCIFVDQTKGNGNDNENNKLFSFFPV